MLVKAWAKAERHERLSSYYDSLATRLCVVFPPCTMLRIASRERLERRDRRRRRAGYRVIWSFVGLGNSKYVNDANGAASGRPFIYTYILCMCVSVSLYPSLSLFLSVSLAKTSYIEIKTKLEQPPPRQGKGK